MNDFSCPNSLQPDMPMVSSASLAAARRGRPRFLLPGGAVSIRFLLACACALLPATARLEAESTAPARTFALTGNDHLLWIISEKWDSDQEAFLNWITWMDPVSMALRQLPVDPQYGQLQALAAWEDSLHLFVKIERPGLTTTGHFAYSRSTRPQRERRLPDDALPLAIAGGSAELPGLWALVDGLTAEAVRVEWEEHQRSLATQPVTEPTSAAEDRPAREPAISARPPEPTADGFFLVAYDGVRWRPGFAAPPNAGHIARAWLAVSGGRCHLFWQNAAGELTVQYASREAETWTNGPPLRFSRPIAQATAGLLNKQLTFAALLEDESHDGLRCEPRVLMPDGQAWIERPPLLAPDGEAILILPKDAMIAGFGDKLAVLRPGEPDPQVGLWSPADGRVLLPFAPVPFRTSSSDATGDRIQEVAYLLAVIGIVLLVYWRRRDTISFPVVLPPGTMAADFGRRGLAALIDMLPAAVIVYLVWRQALSDYFAAWEEAIQTQQTAGPNWWNLGVAWITFASLYTGWCLAFELFMATTPGKRLLGCQVVSESARPAATWQIVVRNALRFLELFPPLRIWPFVLVVLMTRNHQRVGDLLARTLVIQRIH